MSVRLKFNEAKATQAAALLLKLHGKKMNYMKLLKLLYIVDREALLRWGRPVTTDRYVSMDHGPVLSRTYNLISEGLPPGTESVWTRYISAPETFEVSLIADAPNDQLSRAEEKLLVEVFEKFGKQTQWELVDVVHGLPEWQDPDGSAIPIEYRDILKAGNKTLLEIQAVENELVNLATLQSVLP